MTAFHIGYEIRLAPSSFHVDGPFEIGGAGVTHSGFIESVVHISPQHHTVSRQLLLFIIDAQVFQDHVAAIGLELNGIIIFFPDGNAAGIISIPVGLVAIIAISITGSFWVNPLDRSKRKPSSLYSFNQKLQLHGSRKY